MEPTNELLKRRLFDNTYREVMERGVLETVDELIRLRGLLDAAEAKFNAYAHRDANRDAARRGVEGC